MKLRVRQLRTLVQQLFEADKPDSGPFEVGDSVKHGKYKNKSATIKKIYNDEKDHVAIELEPDPKGRKKNVDMGLYKIWPKKEDESE